MHLRGQAGAGSPTAGWGGPPLGPVAAGPRPAQAVRIVLEAMMLTPKVTYLGPSHRIRLAPPTPQDARRR